MIIGCERSRNREKRLHSRDKSRNGKRRRCCRSNDHSSGRLYRDSSRSSRNSRDGLRNRDRRDSRSTERTDRVLGIGTIRVVTIIHVTILAIGSAHIPFRLVQLSSTHRNSEVMPKARNQ